MRRPSFCCDHHAGSGECQPQGGSGESTLSRVRRFLSMGARTRNTSTSCSLSSSSPPSCQKLVTQDPICQSQASALHSLLAELKGSGLCVQSVLGQSLEDVMTLQGGDTTGNGVPTVVHLLCCFILTHGVDYDTLVSSAWCAEEARTQQVLKHGLDAVEIPPGSECSVATGLLRLFLDSLPHAILPPPAQSTILALTHNNDSFVCEDVNRVDEDIGVIGEVVIPKLRRLLYRHLPHYSLCLLRYLAAFLHQLRTSNHNTCPVTISSLGLVLSRVLVGSAEAERANSLGQLLILTYSRLFQNTLQYDDTDGYRASANRPIPKYGEHCSRGFQEVTWQKDGYKQSRIIVLSVLSGSSDSCLSSPGSIGDSRDADDDDDDGDTTSDTDDFRSPPVSPLKLSTNISDGLCPGTTSGIDDFKRQDLNTRSSQELSRYDGSSVGPNKKAPFVRRLSSIDSLTSPSDDDAGSTFSEDDEDNTRTTESSCVSAQEYWETGGESDGQHNNDINHRNLESVAYEERLSSDRFFPVRMSAPRSVEHVHRNRRKTKRKHHYPSKHSHHHRDQENTSIQSSGEEEKSSSYLALLTSEDEAPPARYDPEPVHDALIYQPLGLRNIPEPSYLDSIEPSLGVFKGLIDSNEPVTSDRGSWGMSDAGDLSTHAAPCYRRSEDESGVVARSWYAGEDDDALYPHSSSFNEPQPAPLLDQSTGGDKGTLPPGQTAVKVLMKNINTIKKKIKQFEEEFETAFGYRPSHSEKMKHKDIKKYMGELSKARKELKQMKDDVAGMVSVPSVFPLSLLRCQESTTPGSRMTIPSQASAGAASTLRQVEERLKEKRSACGRKESLSDMTCNELHEEKTALQKALLYYEYIHGRPKTREDRDLARPLYDRYRQCKRNVSRVGSRAKDHMGDLAPIIEHETMDFTLASPQHRGSIGPEEEEEEEEATPTSPTSEEEILLSPSHIVEKEGKRSSLPLGDLHSLPLHELKERKKEAKEEKKRLRRALRDFEEQFERDCGRKVQKEDRGPQEQTYLDYKHSKAKLRLLEALLSKHEPTRY